MPARKQNKQEKSPFGMRLKTLRKEKGLNMEKLAAAVGVSKSYISLLESGGRQPSRDVVIKLAEALESGESIRDELMILAGFAPVNQRAIAAYRDALQIYEQSLNQEPDNFKIFSRLVMALIRSGRHEQARDRIQEGLQNFTHSVEMQCLLAQLELSKGQFKAAVLNQETALRHFEQLPADARKTELTQADLSFNLGAIYFMQAHQQLAEAVAAPESTVAQDVLKQFEQARHYFEDALQSAPEDVYMCDEYARLLFNRAYLLQTEAAWDLTIQAYRQLLILPHKHTLGAQPLMESAAFLAHAYTQRRAFDEAELTLGLLSSFNPNYWLVAYLEACLHTQRHVADGQSEHLDRALRALKSALELDEHNQAHHEASHDPDLAPLRQARAKEMARLLQKEHRS